MAKEQQSLSREEFKDLVRRAVELDEIGRERLNVSRASQIAREVGISPDAWEQALHEFGHAALQTADARGVSLKRVALAAIGGFGAGFLAGVAGGGGILTSVAVIAVAAAIILTSVRKRSAGSTTADLLAWWLTIPVGFMLAEDEGPSDAVWFAALSLAGSIAFDRVLRWFLRRRAPKPTPQTVDLA